MDALLYGFVHSLRRDENETDGTITLRASVGTSGKTESVTADLNQNDYDRAIHAHQNKAAVIAQGDLERVGSRWHLTNPRILQVILREDASEES